MKRTIWILIIGMLATGCANKQNTLDPNYQAYQQAMLAQKPLVSIEWSEDGTRIKKLDVNPQVNIQQKAPDAPHPIWALANNVIKVGGIVGGIWAGGQALEGVIEASRGNYSYVDSYNTTSSYSSTSNTSHMSSETSYPSSGESTGEAGDTSITINKNSGNTTTTTTTTDDHSSVDNSTNGSNNPVDNSINGSYNPVDNSNQNNPVTNPVTQ